MWIVFIVFFTLATMASWAPDDLLWDLDSLCLYWWDIPSRYNPGKALVASIVVVVYGFFCAGMARGKEYEKKRAYFDSIYFLGFLMTLLALMNSLVMYSSQGHEKIEQIITQNGLALGTTVVGLVLRVVFFQFLIPPKESATTDIVDKVVALTECLDALSTSVESELIASIKNIGAKLRDVAIDPNSIQNKLNEIVVQPDSISRKLDKLDTHIEGAGKEIGKKVLAIGSVLGEVVDKLGELLVTLRKVGGEVAEIRKHEGDRHKMVDSLKETNSSVGELVASLTVIAGRLEDAIEASKR